MIFFLRGRGISWLKKKKNFFFLGPKAEAEKGPKIRISSFIENQCTELLIFCIKLPAWGLKINSDNFFRKNLVLKFLGKKWPNMNFLSFYQIDALSLYKFGLSWMFFLFSNSDVTLHLCFSMLELFCLSQRFFVYPYTQCIESELILQ